MKDRMDAVFYGITVPDNWNCQVLPGGSGEADIQFTYAPPVGSSWNLFGSVQHVQPDD